MYSLVKYVDSKGFEDTLVSQSSYTDYNEHIERVFNYLHKLTNGKYYVIFDKEINDSEARYAINANKITKVNQATSEGDIIPNITPPVKTDPKITFSVADNIVKLTRVTEL